MVKLDTEEVNMSKIRSDILRSARHAGYTWRYGTPEATKDRFRETHKILFEAMEQLAEITTRGETSHGTTR